MLNYKTIYKFTSKTFTSKIKSTAVWKCLCMAINKAVRPFVPPLLLTWPKFASIWHKKVDFIDIN